MKSIKYYVSCSKSGEDNKTDCLASIQANTLLDVTIFVNILLQFKEFELYWGAVFLRSVHAFPWFLKANWNNDFGHAETGNGAKKRVVLRREFFSL